MTYVNKQVLTPQEYKEHIKDAGKFDTYRFTTYQTYHGEMRCNVSKNGVVIAVDISENLAFTFARKLQRDEVNQPEVLFERKELGRVKNATHRRYLQWLEDTRKLRTRRWLAKRRGKLARPLPQFKKHCIDPQRLRAIIIELGEAYQEASTSQRTLLHKTIVQLNDLFKSLEVI